jgi:hypothetical protein
MMHAFKNAIENAKGNSDNSMKNAMLALPIEVKNQSRLSVAICPVPAVLPVPALS